MDIQLIGNRIKQARFLRNYTLDDIANDIGVAKSTIQRYENGLISKPKLPVLQAIAESLRVNPSWISGQEVPMLCEDSLSFKIEQRLNKISMSVEEVAEKTGVPLHWLKNIDTFIPGEFGDEEIGYEWITRVAECIGLPGSDLRAALARQERPLPPDLPRVTAKEAFGGKNSYKPPHTLAAHFDGDEYTEEELTKIREFAAFVKASRK